MNNGDTLTGEIDYRGDLALGESIRFRFQSGDSIRKFTPDVISGYRFIDGKCFIVKLLDGQRLFLEYLIQGQVSVFYFRNSATDQYFLEKEGLGLMELPYKVMTVYKNDYPYQFKSTKHKGILNLYMQDAPGFQSRIEKIGEPGKEVLIKLARDYHHEVCPDEECIVFESRPAKIRLNLEVVLGATNYLETGEVENINYDFHDAEFEGRTYVRGGVLAHIWLPQVNEKIYFRTGLLFSGYDIGRKTHLMMKIPLQIEYIYPKGAIRPKLAYGINLYSPFLLSNGLMTGLNVTLNSRSSLGFNYTLDFIPSKFPIIPSGKLLSQSLLAGIYFQL